MNKTKSNKKKFCRQVITPQKRELDRARNSRPVWPCEPLCGALPGASGTGHRPALFGRIWAGFQRPAEDNIGLPPKPSEAGSVGKGGAAK